MKLWLSILLTTAIVAAGPAGAGPPEQPAGSNTAVLTHNPELAEGLVALWSGDAHANDSTVQNHGAAKGVTYTKDRHGASDSAFMFVGGGLVTVPDSDGLDTDQSFTITAWIMPKSYQVAKGGEPCIIGKWDETAREIGDYYICLNSKGRMRFAVGPGPGRGDQDGLTTRAAVPRDSWTHLAATFDRGQFGLYMNGKLAGRGVSGKVKHASLEEYPHDDVIIGGAWNDRHNFEGAIDDVAIWNRALSAEEIHRVFEARSLRDILPGAAAPFVTRLAEADRIALNDGSVLVGTIENSSYTIAASIGRLEIAADRVAGLIPVGTDGSRVRMLLADGQAVAGEPAEASVRLKLADGSTRAVPFTDIRECGHRLRGSKPAAAARPGVVPHSGDMLTWTSCREKLQLKTDYGTVDLPIDGLLWAGPARQEQRGWQAVLVNGSTLSGTMLPEKLTLKLTVGPEVTMARDEIRRLLGPSRRVEPAGQIAVSMRNGDRLVGRLTEKKLTIQTDFGQAEIAPASVFRITFDANQPGVMVAQAWTGTVLRGKLADAAVTVELLPGLAIKVPPSQIDSIARADVSLPREVAQKAQQLIAQLGAEAYKDREAASKALVKMGPSVVALLRQHLKNGDPEIRRRVEEILGKLPAKAKEKPGGSLPRQEGLIRIQPVIRRRLP
ncbi:MAG TPA: LamG domain-containing protein [Phycisphaerae bacterium]|nr:LamG domain-containing protein [Phycisphaerae bacterium]